MNPILSRANLPRLKVFAASNVLLAFDFDGTLAPIAPRPGAAVLRPRTRALMAEAAGLYPCVVISGRARGDLMPRLDGIPLRGAIGNHGAEPAAGLKRPPRILRWRRVLAARLAGLKGVEIEDKSYSLSLHYRRARDKKGARAAILAAAKTLPGARTIGGKQVINVVPANAPDKGKALERARRRLGCDTAIYVGDDLTDEDVFRSADASCLLTIRVGRSRASAAAFFVPNQAQVNVLLSRLIAFRENPPPPGPPRAGPLRNPR